MARKKIRTGPDTATEVVSMPTRSSSFGRKNRPVSNTQWTRLEFRMCPSREKFFDVEVIR